MQSATGLETDIWVGTVLDVSDIAQIRDLGLGSPQKEQNLGDPQKQLMTRVDETVRALWSEGPARIEDYEVKLSLKGTELKIDYVTEETELDVAATSILRNGLRRMLASPDLTLRLNRVVRGADDEH